MHIAKLKQLIAVLLMLPLAGQAIASASMACLGASSAASHQQIMAADTVAMTMSMAMTAGTMDHSQHQAGTSDSDQLGCCPSCDCSLGGCSTVITFAAPPLLASKLHTSVPPHRNIMAFNTLANSLYRPPISH